MIVTEPRTHDGARSGEWLTEPGFGVYVHVPFCAHRCSYCDFNTYEGLDHLHEPYTAALIRAIETWPGDYPPPTSVFFGGGTPTLLPAARLVRILAAIDNRFSPAGDAEITVEANPESVDEAELTALLAGGFNRLSIGVQSLVPHVLEGLGRTHSGRRALDALAAARRAGAGDVNLDLIYGSPWETPDDWIASLDGVIEAGPDHVSAYALTVEEGTPLHTLVATGRAPDVEPDDQAERHAVADERLEAAGLVRYEVSNWARPHLASRHNVLYWSAGDYLGFGAGAHSHVGGCRWWTTRRPRDFMTAVDAGGSAEAGGESLASDEQAGEAMMLGLRLVSGVDLDGFSRRFGREAVESRRPTIDSLTEAALLEQAGSRVRLAPSATMLANDVLCRLL